ncbi:MAG TPA: hypothetical protein VJX10_06350 [Pseudonocardiaceae bacterium]|nr:hypothetical protein [Pseudonocardiaceae bacterium]
MDNEAVAVAHRALILAGDQHADVGDHPENSGRYAGVGRKP